MISTISSGFFQRLPVLTASSKVVTAKALLLVNMPILLFEIGLSYAQHRGILRHREYTWIRAGSQIAGVLTYNFLVILLLKIQVNAFLVFSMLGISLAMALGDKAVYNFFKRRDSNENQSLRRKQGEGNERFESPQSIVARLELEKNDLKSQLGILREQNSTLTNMVDSLQTGLKKEQGAKDVLREKVEKLEEERNRLQQEVAEGPNTKKTEDLCLKVKKLEEKLSNAIEIRQTQEDLRHQIKEIQQKLRLKEMLFAKQNQETKTEEEQLVLEEPKLVRKREKLNRLEKELELLEASTEGLEQAFEEAKHELLEAIEEREQNLKITNEELDRLNETLLSLEAKKEQTLKRKTIIRRFSSYIWGETNK